MQRTRCVVKSRAVGHGDIFVIPNGKSRILRRRRGDGTLHILSVHSLCSL